MRYCKKCGAVLKDDARFCTSCGMQNSLNEADNDEITRDIDKENEVKLESNIIQSKYEIPPKSSTKKSSNKILKVGIPIILVVVVAIAVGIIYWKSNNKPNPNIVATIKVEKIDLSSYPEIKITILAENYKDKLTVNNFTLKEDDVFQKGLKLASIGEDKYNIIYTSSNNKTSIKKNINLACLQDGKEAMTEYSYTVPENSKGNDAIASSDNNTNQSSNSNVVSTYDDNELAIKELMDKYEENFIEAVRYKDTYYLRNSIDLSGNLMNEFTSTIKKYTDQQISEELIEYKIETVNKISDDQYEITTYEKFYIEYGKENKRTYNDYRTIYVVKRTNGGFKVNSIKSLVKLGSKAAS